MRRQYCMHAAVFVLNTVSPDFHCTQHTSHHCRLCALRCPRLFFVTPPSTPLPSYLHNCTQLCDQNTRWAEHTEQTWKITGNDKKGVGTAVYNLHEYHLLCNTGMCTRHSASSSSTKYIKDFWLKNCTPEMAHCPQNHNLTSKKVTGPGSLEVRQRIHDDWDAQVTAAA